MKIISVLLFLLPAYLVCGQTTKRDKVPAFPLVENKIVFGATVPIDSNISKAQLFDNAQQWYKHSFETADNTLTVDKNDSGKLAGTGIIHEHNHEKRAQPYDIYLTIEIYVTKGSYQYRIYDLYSFDKTGKFYYSDMYNEELYPPMKPKWSAAFREEMLNHMNEMVTTVTDGIKQAIMQH